MDKKFYQEFTLLSLVIKLPLLSKFHSNCTFMSSVIARYDNYIVWAGRLWDNVVNASLMKQVQ